LSDVDDDGGDEALAETSVGMRTVDFL